MKTYKARFQETIVMAVLMVFFLMLGMVGMAFAEDFALGDIPLDKEAYEKYIKKLPPDRLDAAHPSSYDARNAGIVTPAKNQGSCGSCWAFASAGALESHLLKKYSAGPYNLSEQQLLRCNTYGYSCSGGSSDASRYWESTGPITETCYPYTATDGSCSYSCTEMVYRVTGWHTVTASEWYFKDSCYNEGPSYWRYQVYSDFSDGVGGGFWNTAAPGAVYVNTSGINRGGHAVLLIGWDDTKGAYLCKNSWGQTGGPNGDGTFWIAYSGHANNLWFGMSNFDIAGGSSPCPTCSGGAVVLNGDTFPSGETCPCTGTTISLINVTVPNNATANFTASTSITVGSGTTFENGSNATLTSPNNTFLPGSHIENGAVLNVGQ